MFFQPIRVFFRHHLARLRRHEDVSKAVNNSAWLAAERVLTLGSALVVNLVLARYLGPDQFGTLNYLLALVGLVLPLSSLGLNSIVVRELLDRPNLQDAVMATAIGLRFIGALIGLAICLMIAGFGWGLETQTEVISFLLMGVAFVFTALEAVTCWFQAEINSLPIIKARVVALGGSALLRLVAVWAGADFFMIALSYPLEWIVRDLAFFWVYQRYAHRLRWSAFSWVYGRTLLRQSVWLMFSGFAAIIYLKIDQVMLAHMVSHAAVGIYSVASRLSEAWYFLPEVIATSFFPVLLALRGDPARYHRRLQQVCDLLVVLAVAVAVACTLFATPIIVFLFGEPYRGAALPLTIHVWAGVFVFMRALANNWLISKDLTRLSLFSNGMGAIFNVLLNLWWIPLLGVVGAAMATVVSYAVASYGVLWVHPGSRPMAGIMTRSLLLPLTFGYRYWSYKR